MITPKLKKFLEDLEERREKGLRIRKTIKYCVYMRRIQNRIDHELDQLLWLCKNRPDIFHGRYYNEYGHLMSSSKPKNERLKKLLQILKVLDFNARLILREEEEKVEQHD